MYTTKIPSSMCVICDDEYLCRQQNKIIDHRFELGETVILYYIRDGSITHIDGDMPEFYQKNQYDKDTYALNEYKKKLKDKKKLALKKEIKNMQKNKKEDKRMYQEFKKKNKFSHTTRFS